jgi:hypothetical protein
LLAPLVTAFDAILGAVSGIVGRLMFCQKCFLIVVEVMLVTGFTSTHFMKYSTATMAKVVALH